MKAQTVRDKTDFLHWFYFFMPSSSTVFQVPICLVCLKCALMKLHSQFLNINLQANFHTWVLQDDMANLWCVLSAVLESEWNMCTCVCICVLMYKPVTITRFIVHICVDISLYQQFMLVPSTLRGTQAWTFLMLPKRICCFLCLWSHSYTHIYPHTHTHKHTHTHTHSHILGRTPVDKGLAHHRDLYNIHKWRTSMPPVGIELNICKTFTWHRGSLKEVWGQPWTVKWEYIVPLNMSLICDRRVTTQNLAFLSYWYRKETLAGALLTGIVS